MKSFLELLKQAGIAWLDDHATRLSASLAYYTMLSIAPLLIISIKIVGVVYGKDSGGKVTTYLSQFIGDKGAAAAQEMVRHAGQYGAGSFATIVGLVIMFISASGVFGELQDSMNLVWSVKPKPNRPFWTILRQRFFSFTLILGTAFLLLISLVVNTILSAVVQRLGVGWFWTIINLAVSIIVITLLFALIFKYIPDVKVQWKPVWAAALLTAALFTIGKMLLGWYLGRAMTTSIYGAAGSLVALLIWVYYSAQILFFGAEFTRVYAETVQGTVQPDKNAVPTNLNSSNPPTSKPAVNV